MMDAMKGVFPAFCEFLHRQEMENEHYGAYDVLPGATEEALRQIEGDAHIELPEQPIQARVGMTHNQHVVIGTAIPEDLTQLLALYRYLNPDDPI